MMSPTNLAVLRQYVIVITFISSNRCNGLSMLYLSLFGTGCVWRLCEGFLIDLWGEFAHDPSSALSTWHQSIVIRVTHFGFRDDVMYSVKLKIFEALGYYTDIFSTVIVLYCILFHNSMCSWGYWMLLTSHAICSVSCHSFFVMELYTGILRLYGSRSVDLLHIWSHNLTVGLSLFMFSSYLFRNWAVIHCP